MTVDRQHLSEVHGFDIGPDVDDHQVELLHARDHAPAPAPIPRPFEPHCHDHHEEPAMPIAATPVSPLDLARTDLANRAHAAIDAENWAEHALLVELAEVADMVCRIGDQTHSPHYRAEKSGPLVVAALRLQRQAFDNYGAREEASAALGTATVVLEEVFRSVRSAMWNIARGEEIYDADARALRSAVHALFRWVEPVSARAVADPVA